MIEMLVVTTGRHSREREARVGNPGNRLQYNNYFLGSRLRGNDARGDKHSLFPNLGLNMLIPQTFVFE